MSENNTDSTSYYYSNGQRISLVRDREAYAVRFRGGAKSDSNGLSLEARALLRNNSEHLDFIPNHNLQVYRLVQPTISEAIPAPPGTTAPAGAPPRPDVERNFTMDASPSHATLFNRLQAEPVVEFAAPVYRRGQSGDMMLVTRQFVAQFKPNVTRAQIDEFNASHGVTILETLGYADNGYLLEAPAADGPSGPVALGNLYFESGLTEFAHADLITKRYFRSAVSTVPNVPVEIASRVDISRNERNVYQSQQWHLASANIIDAWSITRGRSDIKICILDDGVDVAHAEFSGKISVQFDFFTNTTDARPKGAQDNHGTACAGVATASGVKALGAAPGCSLIAGVTPAWGAFSEEARMFRWAADQGADVISCSWGPQDGTGAVDPLPDVTRAAIRYCVTQGRRGKGCSVLFAAGNGNESVSNDGYASNPDVMAIAASTDADAHAFYSDFGPEVSICAPSNGGSRGILTTDRSGSAGYNKNHPGADDPDPRLNDPFADLDYTSKFGGTSSSTPLVAGVVGLMLSANPNLTPSQVRQCLQNTATKIGPASSYDTRGHSPQFGFGKVNAGAAVREAQRLLGNVSSTATPTVTAQQQSVPRSGPPPSFSVNPQPNTHYAFEIAARRELLDVESGQPLSEYYASWEESPFMSAPVYTLPQTAWDRIKNNNQLFYRVWTSSSATDWVNTISSTGATVSAAAASIQILAQQNTGGPTMNGPASVARSGQPPSFTIDPGTNTHYTVEFAARPELMDAESGQPAGEYYASWEDTPFMSDRTYQMPQAIWNRLKSNPRLFFRAWTTSSPTGWANTLVTAESGATASTIEISGSGSSPAATPRSVTFPSGISLNVTDSTMAGGIDYSDPQGSGIPLLSVAGRGNERVSSSFLVKELAGANATFARIDVALVEALQNFRNAVGAAVIIVSAYRHPAQDQQARGLPNNGHVSGQTAEIRVAGRTARDLARLALETLGCQIGIGLGANSIEIDVRGSLATWVLPGAAMSAQQFEDFVGETCPIDRNRMAGGRSRTLMGKNMERMSTQKPAITGPETANAAGPSPEFLIVPGRNSYYAVEVAVDPADLTGSGARQNLSATRFYGSWLDGMCPIEGVSTTYSLPQSVWEKMARAALEHRGRLYYRLITTSAPDPTWPNAESSLTDDDFRQAPGIDIWSRPERLVLGSDMRAEEVLWREL